MCSRNQWGMSIERSILYITKDNSCYKKNNRCRRNIIAAKISWFTYDKILHPAETALSKQHNHIRAY
jgi:hypothetical protein